MSDYDELVSIFKDLELQNTINLDHTTLISRDYPGAFYRKVYDNGKIKVYRRGTVSKVYAYPHFKPRKPSNNNNNNIYVGCVEQSYQYLEASNECWRRLDGCSKNSAECQKIADECRYISIDFWNKSNDCFRQLNDNNKS